MDPFLVGILGVVTLLVLLAVGVHIGVALGLVGVLGLIILLGLRPSLTLVATTPFYFATNSSFIVIPTFTLMGLAAMYGGLSGSAFDALSKLMHRLPGALGIASVAGCTVFGTVSGSSVVTATVFAKVACPEMRKHGYDKRFAYGIVATAGMIGMLIPPSMLIVIYALISGESVGTLLMAGIGPGLLLAVMFSVGVIIMAKLRPNLAPSQAIHISWRQRLVALKGMWPMMLTGLVLIGGLYGGVFTASEAAAWGALVVLLISVFWGRMRWKQLWNILGETVGIMGMIFLLMCSARLFARFLAVSGISKVLINTIIGMNPNTGQLLLGVMVLYLILGCFLDSISMLLLTVPLIRPVLIAMGIDPIWFAMVIILAIEAGLVTPPVGLNVYGVKSVAEPDVTLEDIFRGAVPFLLMTVVCIVILIFVPAIATWLPQQMIR